MDPTVAAAVISGLFVFGVALIKLVGSTPSPMGNGYVKTSDCERRRSECCKNFDAEIKDLNENLHDLESRVIILETKRKA